MGSMPDTERSTTADIEGFTAFMAACQHRMIRLAELLTADHGRAEDLAQHGFAMAYSSWRRLRDDNPEAYVRRCIVNGHYDWWRRRMWRERPGAVMPERADNRDQIAIVTERDLVFKALGRLTARERAVIVLRYYLDLSEAQIAGELGIRPGTVKSTTARALAKLRDDAELTTEALA